MSYHLALRSIQFCHRAPGVGSFVDCLFHCLHGDHSAQGLRLHMRRTDVRKLSVTSVSDRLKQLLFLDLNPIGQAVRLAKSEQTFHRLWEFYNQGGNVVAQIDYNGVKVGNVADAIRAAPGNEATHEERMNEASSHETVLESYRAALVFSLHGNTNESRWTEAVQDSRVSALARIMATGNLVVELSEFFESFPHAKVADACRALGVHPRMLERSMRESGLTAVMLKRACMLARASHDLLWTTHSFVDVARRRGYADAAHLNRVISDATGGMTPSMVRRLG